MNGMTHKCVMKSEAGLYKIWPDCCDVILQWICAGLGENTDWIGENYTFGISYKDKMVGGLIFNNYRPNVDVWLTIYSTSPRWCSKFVLKYIFKTCFETLNCRRVNVLVSKSNKRSFDLCRRLGFVKEGFLRQYRENGEDCYIMGMLKKECRWL